MGIFEQILSTFYKIYIIFHSINSFFRLSGYIMYIR